MTWCVESLLAAIMLFSAAPHSGSGPAPPLERLRQLLAERWAVAEQRVLIEADSVALALLDHADDRRISRVLGSGRVIFSDPALQRARVRAGVVADVPVATLDLPRDVIINDTVVRLERRVHWGGRAPAYPSPLGQVTTRALRAGEALIAPAVAAPVAVRAGDAVQAVWQQGNVRLELRVRAAGTGAVGDTIAIRTETGRRLNAVVTAPRELLLLGSERRR